MSYIYKAAFRNKWLGQPATAQGVVPATAGLLSSAIGQPVQFFYARAQNRFTAAAAMAVVALMKDIAWEAGQWVNATTTYTVDTTDAQSAGTNDVALETLTAQDGFLVGADMPFGALSLDITTAGVGNTTHVIEYWNGVWVAIPAIGMLSDIARAAVWSTGENLVLFDPPADWIKGGSGTNVNQNRYNLRIRCTTVAAGTAALARRIYVGVVLLSEDQIGINASIERFSGATPIEVPVSCAAVGMACASVDEGNALELIVA